MSNQPALRVGSIFHQQSVGQACFQHLFASTTVTFADNTRDFQTFCLKSGNGTKCVNEK